jgi:hypothetical protein
MSGYVVAGYAVTVGGLGLYALRVVMRGRALTRSLSRSGRRWR